MAKLKCACLNITLHVKDFLASDVDGKKFVSDGCDEEFFCTALGEIELGVGGITKELAVLVRKHRTEDWDIYTCLNCGVKSFALHAVKGFNRVLISKQLINDEKKVEELSKSSNFSSAFKIVLNEKSENDSGGADTSVTLGQNSLAKSMSSVQELLKKYLKAEEAAMEERIRKYTEQQKATFATLRSVAFKDKMSVQRVLEAMEEKALTDSISEAMFTDATKRSPHVQASLENPQYIYKSANGPSHQITSTPISSMRPIHITQVPVNQKMKNHQQNSRRKKGNTFQRHSNLGGGNASAEADIMFDIEGFSSGDSEPFFESDPEDESSDNSSQPDESIILANLSSMSTSSAQAINQSVYSASLPISMPAITRNAQSWEDDVDEIDKVETQRPDKIAESMKALALSVQNSSRHMFGDLPRSRTNTYAHSHRS